MNGIDSQKTYRGKIKNWNEDKGFGFVNVDELPRDVFLHISLLKHMSREPKQGDYVHVTVIEDAGGKLRASSGRIEGVMAKSTKPQGIQHKRPTRHRRSYSGKSDSRFARTVRSIIFLALVFVAIDAYQLYIGGSTTTISDEPSQIEQQLAVSQDTQPAKPRQAQRSIFDEPEFTCDGRQHCSQMRSYEEALFFIRHCPNTKMDGDHDGKPCENDSRW
ncbi:excalibur calcium-binding domain-containing protein [Thalassotalea sp. PS06]|uniref:excalibur calcium-binding domain-containing protein n=1 Tax=Thalassotalea sp. PS06 TaxID=2594005 RepID=UPI00163D5DBF|nr:excalibur calcium-binding domain-containing protein [Thalassotalea sp. PS06]